MKNNKSVFFAAKVADKKQVKQWKADKKDATAGCSGPWARANSRWFGRDNGMYC